MEMVAVKLQPRSTTENDKNGQFELYLQTTVYEQSTSVSQSRQEIN